MTIEIHPVRGLPEIERGDRLGELIAAHASVADGDVVVVSQKVVSKAEGRTRRLSDVEPGSRARELAAQLDKDPALVQLVLDESSEVVRAERGVLITRTSSGWICANAGIDSSNVPADGSVTLLPADPDSSARRIRAELKRASGRTAAIVVSDSFGRPWRLGQSDVAIGCAGLEPLDDWRGLHDRGGRDLTATVIALADEVAAAADLVRDKAGGLPVAVVRGLADHVAEADGPGAAALQRPAAQDLFR